jgi:hypothetical protein
MVSLSAPFEAALARAGFFADRLVGAFAADFARAGFFFVFFFAAIRRFLLLASSNA